MSIGTVPKTVVSIFSLVMMGRIDASHETKGVSYCTAVPLVCYTECDGLGEVQAPLFLVDSILSCPLSEIPTFSIFSS